MKMILLKMTLAFAVTVLTPQEIEDARIVLIRLAGLSKKQALQTEAARNLMTGGMLNIKANSFGFLADAPDMVLPATGNRVVGRFQVRGTDNRIVDVYFYLENDKGWRVHAIRMMALTGIFEQSYAFMKSRTDLNEKEKQELANVRLTLAPDKDLRAWFSENKNALDRLRIVLQTKHNKTDSLYVRRDDREVPEAAALLQNLNLSTALVERSGNVEIVIGGVTDNTVGFIYSPSNKPPEISSESYIWVEKVAEKWFLFRTT